jgi:hypothetical protein
MIHDVFGCDAAMPRSAVLGIRRNCGSSSGILSLDPFLLRPLEMFALGVRITLNLILIVV